VLKISPRHALTDAEFAFIRIYAAFGKKNAPEAWRRAFCVLGADGEFYLKGPNGEPTGDPLSSKTQGARANTLLGQDYIQGFLDELERGVGDQARDALAEEVAFGSEQARLKAVQRVLDDEDKLGFRNAVDAYFERACAIGAEVVVPLPGPGAVVMDLRQMFPTFAEALPPPDVLVKTMKSLDQYLWVQMGRMKGEDVVETRDPRKWKFLDGFNEFVEHARAR
jgi:hypothetical protein